MAAISHVFTIRRAAQILGHDEDLLWQLSDQLEPEDGKLWVYDIDGAETPAFTHDGIEAFGEFEIRSIAGNLMTSVPRCSAYVYPQLQHPSASARADGGCGPLECAHGGSLVCK